MSVARLHFHMAADTVSTQPKRRRLRKWLIGIAAVGFVAVVLVMMVPTFVSWGLANSYLRSAIQESIDGTVELDRINASWFGDQGVEGLQVKYPNGKTAVRVDLSVDEGLLGLVFGGDEPIDIM